jgi:hypothetical protein
VIVGHVDSKTGPAVFFRLSDIHAGANILVDRSDGTTAVFSVLRRAQYSKDQFPTHAVYDATKDSQLRLVTCGGSFDHIHGRYLDNTVIYAQRVQ